MRVQGMAPTTLARDAAFRVPANNVSRVLADSHVEQCHKSGFWLYSPYNIVYFLRFREIHYLRLLNVSLRKARVQDTESLD